MVPKNPVDLLDLTFGFSIGVGAISFKGYISSGTAGLPPIISTIDDTLFETPTMSLLIDGKT